MSASVRSIVLTNRNTLTNVLPKDTYTKQYDALKPHQYLITLKKLRMRFLNINKTYYV